MPIAPIDSKGNSLFFTDSGPVAGSDDYTTLVIYHGSAFTGHTFHKLLSLGAEKNIRIVILNRRDYPGSTKYSESEIEDLNAGRKVFLERLGLEVAYFLTWFAEKSGVPKISTDGKSGGFAVLGWSMGNATSLALLGHSDVIAKSSYAKLQPYLRKFILYDPPHLVFGYDQPEEYNPVIDPDCKSPEEAFKDFSYWVSEYYSHPNLASRSAAGLDFSKHATCPSIERMSPEEMKVNFNGAAGVRTEGSMFTSPMQPTLKEQAQRVLFDETLAQGVLPDLQIAYLTCQAAPWECLWGFFETERRYDEHVARGHKVRPIRFFKLEGANHFVHWDDPEAFFAATADAIHS